MSATALDEIEAILRTAITQLLPAGTPHRFLVVLHDGLNRGDGILLRPVRDLSADIRDRLDGFPLALVCPLTVGTGDSWPDDPNSGALVVAAPEAALVNVQGFVEVLAGQAALARERIRLVLEINHRASEEYFRTLVQNSADIILIVDDERTIRYASPSVTQTLGSDDLTGVSLLSLLDRETAARAAEVIDMLQAGESHTDGADWQLHTTDGKPLRVSASVRDLRDDSTVRGLVVTFTDVTDRRQLEQELTHQAFHDSLTGLANRVLFADRLQQAVTRAGRTGALLGVLVINLDDFKTVNDTAGHQTGDRLLAMAAQRLQPVLRTTDTVARLGGDEFAVLAEDLSSPAELTAMVTRIVGAFAEPFDLTDRTLTISAGIGVASTVHASSAAELLRQADLALHIAKRAGKAQWRRYQPALHTPMLEQQQLRADFEQAIVDKAFAVYFQPIVDLGSGVTVGMEALVRWQHPERGIVPPDQFIPLAEETGLIVPLGLLVLEEALQAAARWRLSGRETAPYVSVNVSARQFRTVGFVDDVTSRLAAAELPATSLLIEITESMLLRDDEQAWVHLATLREHGIRVAIDDFGTGYSSLSYLRQVPVDVVKIDKSFIDGLGDNGTQRALTEGILRLAQSLELDVVAE
ncbi:EAL domain-containing protein, partial [Actinoplanes sp. NPDC051633]|uniref:putative bifunctional diguanylate cyclase/phosphodiesterase n=1 Tax=Actinoplanes sp. NPDC051633 TaxID=3155670 RepID=UPI00343407EC